MSGAYTRPNRMVHASNGIREIVRYDKAGKWYLECEGLPRIPLSLRDAVIEAHRNGWTVRLGIPGGTRFDSLYRRWSIGG